MKEDGSEEGSNPLLTHNDLNGPSRILATSHRFFHVRAVKYL